MTIVSLTVLLSIVNQLFALAMPPMISNDIVLKEAVMSWSVTMMPEKTGFKPLVDPSVTSKVYSLLLNTGGLSLQSVRVRVSVASLADCWYNNNINNNTIIITNNNYKDEN